VPELTPADFEALGVYDPGDVHAAEQLGLLEYLVSLGATGEDLAVSRDALPGLAAVLALRGGGQLTLSEAAERAGISSEKLLRLVRAAGFPEPPPGDRVIGEQFAALAAGVAAAEEIFGADAVLQLVRVMGSAMARLADAIVSAFLVNVEAAVRDEDPVGLGIARANTEAVALIPTVNAMLDVLLRQHIIGARRSLLGGAADGGYETQRMAVGFVDLVGSTAMSQRLSTQELGVVLTTFEHLAVDSITTLGGRVVKLIGDEVLYTAVDEPAACSIALTVVAQFKDHPIVPKVRAGVASGQLLLRDGDVFGPTVNLAARATKAAGPDEIVAPVAFAIAAGITGPLDRHQLKGFDDEIELCRLNAP
jgi:adenylate cyclase